MRKNISIITDPDLPDDADHQAQMQWNDDGGWSLLDAGEVIMSDTLGLSAFDEDEDCGYYTLARRLLTACVAGDGCLLAYAVQRFDWNSLTRVTSGRGNLNRFLCRLWLKPH